MNQKLSEYRNSKGKSHSLSTKSKYQNIPLHMIEKVTHTMIDVGEGGIVSAPAENPIDVMNAINTVNTKLVTYKLSSYDEVEAETLSEQADWTTFDDFERNAELSARRYHRKTRCLSQIPFEAHQTANVFKVTFNAPINDSLMNLFAFSIRN